MHISKVLAVLCVSALGTASLLAQRPDNDVQTRARQQLREAMGELNGVPATNSPPTSVQPANPAPVAPAKPMPAPAPIQPVVTPVKPAAAPAPAPTQPAVTPPVTPMVKPMPTTAAAPVKTPAKLSPEAEMKARAALHQAEMEAQPMTYTSAKPAEGVRPGTKPAYVDVPTATPNPLTVPPPQLSGSKEQRLQALASQYKSDQISAKVYHEQKAKILAEP